MTAAEVAKAHPEAVRIAQECRDVFGDDVRLIHAKNLNTGESLGRDHFAKSS